jgi:hypothetical protein
MLAEAGIQRFKSTGLRSAKRSEALCASSRFQALSRFDPGEGIDLSGSVLLIFTMPLGRVCSFAGMTTKKEPLNPN